LKPGMFATVEIHAELDPSTLLVPDTAVVRSGEKNTVFVALDGGRFEPRAVTLGPRSEDNTYQVLSGLKEEERVVTSGQFMLDSESQLREAIQKMLSPGGSAAKTPEHPPYAAPAPSVEPAGPTGPTAYICPMPEHASIKYDHAGKCPICGMTLIPFTSEKAAEMPAPGSTPSPMPHQH
ncbi:MAG: heavy metal-binding domain-containing protein, partial [bacterium]